MKFRILLLLMFVFINDLHAQLQINEPIRFRDSLKIEYVKEYSIDNFICSDTSLTIYEMDAKARIKKMERYFKGVLRETMTHVEDKNSGRIVQSVNEKFVETKFIKPGKLIHYYEYDGQGNITAESVYAESDSLVEKTNFTYSSDNELIKIEYEVVPKRFQRSKPPGSYNVIQYDYRNNEKEVITYYASGKQKKRKVEPIEITEEKPKNGELSFTVEDDYKGSKRRTNYEFSELGFWVRIEGYMELGGKEQKLFTKFREVKYKTNN